MAESGKKPNSEPTQPITVIERRLITIMVAMVPTVFIALGTFIWTIDNKVVMLQGVAKITAERTQDRYTKEDAREDHKRVHESFTEVRREISKLSSGVNQLKGLHETHKHPG